MIVLRCDACGSAELEHEVATIYRCLTCGVRNQTDDADLSQGRRASAGDHAAEPQVCACGGVAVGWCQRCGKPLCPQHWGAAKAPESGVWAEGPWPSLSNLDRLVYWEGWRRAGDGRRVCHECRCEGADLVLEAFRTRDRPTDAFEQVLDYWKFGFHPTALPMPNAPSVEAVMRSWVQVAQRGSLPTERLAVAFERPRIGRPRVRYVDGWKGQRSWCVTAPGECLVVLEHWDWERANAPRQCVATAYPISIGDLVDLTVRHFGGRFAPDDAALSNLAGEALATWK